MLEQALLAAGFASALERLLRHRFGRCQRAAIDAIGSRMEELRQVLPALSRSQIQVLLREMVEDKRVHVHGATRAARWHHGPETPDCNHEAPK
jgi:hypothetical protein